MNIFYRYDKERRARRLVAIIIAGTLLGAYLVDKISCLS